MKKIVISFLMMGFLLVGGTLKAQVPIAMPNASFEQWTNHSGYNVTVLVFPINIYQAYTTPTGWDYLSYPVNETVSMMGMNININTSVPIVLSSSDTAGAPDGSTAVRLQTLMLSDIVNSTVLSMAGSSIDPSLTQQVIPSILSTGAVDIDALIPILSDVLTDTGDIMTMLPTLLAMDVNDFISGGLPLGGLRPGVLTGSYKYESATEGDNGGVVMVGTKYNTTLHKREIVGVGFNIGLTDTGVYTPFEVVYAPLSDLVPGAASPAPDSLVVLLVSSASTNMQQGSVLWLDNLMLWSAPDTCADIIGLMAMADIHEAMVTWSVADQADSFELEYGPHGFVPGNGTVVATTGTAYALSGLEAGTGYDVYVRSLCNDTTYGESSMTQFATGDDTCSHVVAFTAVADIHEAVLNWSVYGTVAGYEMEYGYSGFAHGSGTVETPEGTTMTLTGLEANTWYDVYLRTVCTDSVYGEWSMTGFQTGADTCAAVIDLGLQYSVADTLGSVPEATIVWSGSSQPDHWEVEYGLQGFELGSGIVVTTEEERFDIFQLEESHSLLPNRWYDFYIISACGGGVYGVEDSVHYLSLCAEVTDLAAVGSEEDLSVTDDDLIAGYGVSWTDTADAGSWEVVYGHEGTRESVIVDTTYFELPPLEPETEYYVSISAHCGEGNLGRAANTSLTTMPLPTVGIRTTESELLVVKPNPAMGRCTATLANGNAAEFRLYSLDGRLLQTIAGNGGVVEVELPSKGVFFLQATTTVGTVTRKVVSR